MPQFDPNRPGLVQAEVTDLIVFENPPAPEVSNLVLDPNADFFIRVTWSVRGQDAPAWLNAGTGNWNVQAYAESIGGGFEGLIARDDSVAPNPNIPILDYDVTLRVPAGTLAEGNPGSNDSGLYKLAVAVFLNSNLPKVPPGRGFDMIGFREGPVIQIEDLQ